MRRMMDKMGLDMQEMPNVREVLIRTDKKEIILSKPEVTMDVNLSISSREQKCLQNLSLLNTVFDAPAHPLVSP